MCRKGGRDLLFLSNICKIDESRKNRARLWAGLRFPHGTEGLPTRRRSTLSTFCPTSPLGFGPVTCLGPPSPLCKAQVTAYKRVFPQVLEEFPSFLYFCLNCRQWTSSEALNLAELNSVQRTRPASES